MAQEASQPAGHQPSANDPRRQSGAGARRPLALYVHFPYCVSKCPYCDFASVAAAPGTIDHLGYADAVLDELRQRAGASAGRRLGTIFIGGGTPSLWQPEALHRLLSGVRTGPFPLAADCEVSLECNPSSLGTARAAAFVDAGVTRLTVGVQALEAGRLRHLARAHDRARALEAVRAARDAGARQVGVDLLFGVATADTATGAGAALQQTASVAVAEALELASLGVDHLSAYALTIEPATPFGEALAAGRLPRADDAVVAESFTALERALAERGFEHYEISSYARAGNRCRHNLAYWRGDDYLGLGCAAVSTMPAGSEVERRTNPREPRAYLDAVRQGTLRAHQQVERLDPPTRLRERIMLGLRTSDGCDLRAARAELGLEPWTEARRAAADALVEQGRLEIEGETLRIPHRAWLFADSLIAALI